MRAVVQSSYRPPDQLRIETLGVPQIGDTDVLVEVHAAGAGRGAWHLLTRTPLMNDWASGCADPGDRWWAPTSPGWWWRQVRRSTASPNRVTGCSGIRAAPSPN